jgi:isoquinoline 1-oxidoreductase beta subunit
MSASFKSLDAGASRREFLKVSVAAGGGLLLGFALPRGHTAEHAESAVALFAPDAFIRIDRTGTVTLIMCQVEMGQGVYTSISQILADELDVDFKHVVVEAAPPNDALYTNPALGFQVTGGST